MKSAKLVRVGGLAAVLGSPADELDEYLLSGRREGGAIRPGPVQTSA